MTQSSTPQFAIVPLESIGPVKLGMTRAEVRDVLANFADADLDQSGTLDYAFGSSLQIQYDANGRADFIGAGWHKDCGCDYTLDGEHVADLPAREMFASLAKLDGTAGLSYNPDSFLFPRIHATVWQADSQYDVRGAETRPMYAQVGIGSDSYAESWSDE